MATISSDQVLAMLIYELHRDYLTKDKQEELKQTILEYVGGNTEASPVWGDLATTYGQNSFDQSMQRLVLGGTLDSSKGSGVLSISFFLDIMGEKLLVALPENVRGEIATIVKSFKNPPTHA